MKDFKDKVAVVTGDAKFAGTLRANLCKCGDKTANRHYLSWNYVNSEKPDCHRPQDFGTMVFE